jgi:4-amino-4-deoxy-L-arabinose transferase-like glycosyltransferase
MESRWRMPAIFNPTRFGLALALIAAALLRFWALPQGVPFSVQVDEPEVLVRAVRMMKTGDFNPHFFDYPTLYMYMQAGVALVRFLFGAMQGQWAALSQAPHEEFYVWGRALTAAMGTATIWGVYRAGMRLGQRKALLAAGMFAVMPLHVRESHFVLTDVPMTFFVLLTLVMSLRARERATVRAFAWAGAAAGLAAGTKYNGVLALLLPIIACLITPAVRPSRLVALFWIVTTMVLTFLVVAPYTVLDLPNFLNQFARLTGEYRAPSTIGEPVWLIYLKHLRNALRWPGSLIVIAGFLLGLYRIIAGPDRGLWLLLTIFPIAYFRFISNQSIFYGRYLLPLLPFLSILGAAAVVMIVDLVRTTGLPKIVRNAVTIALALITIAPPAYTSITFNANAAKVWTTELAYKWITRELPPGTVITFESRQVLLPLTYKATYLPQLRMHPLEHYVKNGVQYVVASSAINGPYFDIPSNGPARYPEEYEGYMSIFRQSQEVARFSPSSDHPGPELRIFRIAGRIAQ